MIDIHNHLLVGVDDGPSHDDEMMSLLKQAKEQGITGIVLTPHHLHPRFKSNHFENIVQKITQLKQREDIKELGIELYPGQEIRLNGQIYEDIEKGRICGINSSQYLLIELPTNELPHYTKSCIYRLQTMGYIPIIVHPERNKVIAKDINLLFELINGGALSQITASSLTGVLGKKIQTTSIRMIEHNLIHFIASDAHHVKTRPFRLAELFKTRELRCLEEEIEYLLNNNKEMINNKVIKTKRPIKYIKKKHLGLF